MLIFNYDIGLALRKACEYNADNNAIYLDKVVNELEGRCLK